MSVEDRLKRLRNQSGAGRTDLVTERINALRGNTNANANMADLLPEPEQTGSRITYVSNVNREPDYRDPLTEIAREEAARASRVPLTGLVTETAQAEPTYGVQSVAPGRGGGRGRPQPTGWDYVGSKQREVGEALANSPVGVVQRSFAGGVANGVRDIGNALGYIGQMQAQTAMLQADPYLRMWGQDEIADKNAAYVQSVQDEGYKPLGTVLERAGVTGAAQVDQGVRDFANAAATDAKNGGKVINVVAQTANGVGGMVPNILSNMVAPGSGMWVLGAKVFGNATESALDAGASNENAVLYGGAVAAVEVLTEMMFDGIPGLRGNGERVLSVSKGVEKVVGKYIKNAAAQTAVMAAINTIGEAVEEFVAEFGDWGMNKLLVGSDNRSLSEVHKDAWYSAFLGALISFVMSTPSNILNIMSPQEIADGVMRTEEANRTYKPDYFDNMSPEEAKAEYIRLMKQFHPDTSTDPQAAQYSAEINDAYDRFTKNRPAAAQNAATQPAAEAQGVNAAQTARLPAAQNTAQRGSIYQQALDMASWNQQTEQSNLPQYRPVAQPPVDAQRAQIGEQMAAKAATPAEVAAAQSAKNAPTAAQQNRVEESLARYRGTLAENEKQQAARHTEQQLSDKAPARVQDAVKDLTAPQPVKSTEAQADETALTELRRQASDLEEQIDLARVNGLSEVQQTTQEKPMGRTEEEKLATQRRGYEQEKRIVADQSPERQQYLKDTYDAAKPVLDQLRPGDTLVDDNGNEIGTVLNANEYGITISGDTLTERIPAGTFSNSTAVAGNVFGDDPLWHFEHNGTPIAQGSETQYNGENTPKEVVTSGRGEEQVREGNGDARQHRTGDSGNNSGDRGKTGRNLEAVSGAKDQDAGNLSLGRKVSLADFGVKDADTAKSAQLVTGGETKHTSKASANAKKNGRTLVMFSGNLGLKGGKEIEGFSQAGRNLIGANASNGKFTVDQIAAHEEMEIRIGSGEFDVQKMAAEIAEVVDPGVYDDITDIYRMVLYPDMSDEGIAKEMICDAAGKMNRLSGTSIPILKKMESVIDDAFGTIHDYFNSVTDNAFELADESAMDVLQSSPDAMGNAIADALDAGDIETATEFSYASLANAAGFKAIEENGVRAFMKDGKTVEKVTPEDIKASPIGAMIQYAADKGYLGNGKAANDANAEKQIRFFADVCTLAAKNNDFAMSMQFVGAETFTAIKANSDKQYGTTNDYKSVCIKTQSVIDSMSSAMVAKKGGLTKQEILDIYRRVNEIGLPVNCPECYVFSRWIGIGGLLDNIWKYQERYGAMTFEEVKAAYDTMHDRVAAKAEEAGLSFGKAKTKLSAKITKEYQKQLEKVETTVNRGDQVSDADAEKLKVLESTMTDVKALTWIESVYFGGKAMTRDNVSKNYRVPAKILFDLNRGAEFATQYKDAWAFRTTQGAGYGKAITPYSEASLGEGILGTLDISGTVKKKANRSLKNPFLDSNGKLSDDAKKKLDRAAKKQKTQLFRGGQRFNSTSDASNDVASDYLLSMLEMQTMHGGVQIYTKVDGSVEYLANVGAFINQSLMPLGGGLDDDGNLRDTSTGGMSPSAAFRNREKYESAGTITIGVNDDHIRALYNDPRRDFVIPYHTSGGDAAVVSEMRAIQDPGAAMAARARSTDYTRMQNEKILSDAVLKNLGNGEEEIAQIKANRAARIAILTGKQPNMAVVRANPILSNLYDMFNGGKWDGVTLPKTEIESHIYPNEFWDTDVDFDHSGVNTELYLQYCDDLGMLHKFSGMVPRNGTLVSMNGYDRNGERVQLTDLAYKYVDGKKTDEIEPFFWRTLTDRRMYGNAGQYLEQGAINLSNLGVDVVKDFAKYNTGRGYDREKSMALAKEIGSEYAERFGAEDEEIYDTEFSTAVTDEDLLKRLEAAEKQGIVEFKDIKPGDQKGVVKVYRAMQAQPVDADGNVIPNATLQRVISYDPLVIEAKVFSGKGKKRTSEIITAPAKLFSPMAGQYKGVWRAPIELNKWEMSEGHPERATPRIDEATGKPKIDTDKKNASYGEVMYDYGLEKGGVDDSGKPLGDVPARYNPYTHTSVSALNDQFSSANKRSELVTVEVLVPVWHINNGEKNERLPLAKDRVGAMSWHSGPTSSRLAKIGKPRTVILTRYDKPIRVVPDAEVAKSIAENIGDSKNISIPSSVVTPSLGRELRALGVSVLDDAEWKEYNEKYPTEKFAKLSGNTEFSTAPAELTSEQIAALDKKYLNAIKTGDMQSAQKMVDEAAKAAGYDIKVYRGGGQKHNVFDTKRGAGDTQFGPGTYFTDAYGLAQDWAKERAHTIDDNGYVGEYYIKAQNLFSDDSTDFNTEQWENVERALRDRGVSERELKRIRSWGFYGIAKALQSVGEIEEGSFTPFSWRNAPKVNQILREAGYDGIEAPFYDSRQYVIFDPTQAKSTDPITYDDNGNVIPLSERFNTKNEDIRFSSASEIDRLEAENERLRKRLEEARAETKLTRGWKADPKDVERAAKTIADSASSKISQTVLQNRLSKLVEDASNGEISEDEVIATAGSIARDVVEKSSALASKDLTSYNAAKSYLKQIYIEVPEALRASFDDFKSFAQTHKEMRMKTEGVAIADVYAELQRDLGKEYFPDMTRAKDMLQQIGDVMNSLAPVYGNQYSFAMQMVIEEMSNEVLGMAMDIGQKITYADRAAAKLSEANAENKATTEKLKTAESYIRSLQRIATRRAEQNEALKQHYAESAKKKREARDLRQSQDKLMRVLKRLNNRKLPMATKQEILDAQNAVAGVVDTVQKYFTGELKAKKWTEQGITDIGQLEEFIRRKTVEGLDPDMYDPNFIVDGATKRILDRYKMTSVKDMTATQIKELTQALLNIEARIAAEKKAVNSQLAMEFYQAGTETIGDVSRAKPGSIQRKLRPLSAFLRMSDYNDDSPLVVLYKEMLRGEEEADMYQREALMPFKNLLSDHKWLKSAYGKDAETIKLPGVDIDGNNVEAEITPMMRVELYLDSLNDDNFRHVYEGGVIIPDMEWYRKGDMTKAYNNGKRVKFTRPTLQRLLEQMSQNERTFARLLQTYYNEFAPNRMNPVSLALDGWEKFTTPDYYPISVDKNFLNADYESKLFAADASLARPGFGEERIHSAKPIYLRDANTRFLQMLAANSMYAHQAIPLHNMNRLLNVQLTGNADSVKAALGRQFPDGSADNYLSKFMNDYAGHRKGSSSNVDKKMDKLRSNYTSGVLSLGLSTAGIQFASFPTAAAVVSPAALFQALTPGTKIDTSFIDKRTAVFTKRTEGFSMLELAEMREQGKHVPKVLNPIQAVDVGTTALLKRAAYFEIRNTRKDLHPGTEEFEKAVTDVYIRIVEETQPNYSVALRPEVLRSDSSMERAMIMFATQPLQQYGIIYDAIGRYESARRHYKTDKSPENKAKLKQAEKGLGRSIGVLLASSLAYALLKLGVDSVLGNYKKKYTAQDENDTDAAAFARQFGLNLVGGLTGMYPIGKTIIEFGMAITDIIAKNLSGRTIFGKKWYGYELSTISAIGDAADSVYDAADYITRAIAGKSETKTAVKHTISAAEDIALLLGIPAERIHQYLRAIGHWAGVEEDDLYDLIG